MKYYTLFFVALMCIHTALNASWPSNIQHAISNAEREYLGHSLVSLNDPRVIALITTGVLTISCGCWLMNSMLHNKKESTTSNFLKKTVAFFTGNALVVLGLFEIFLARPLLTFADVFSHEIIKNIHKD